MAALLGLTILSLEVYYAFADHSSPVGEYKALLLFAVAAACFVLMNVGAPTRVQIGDHAVEFAVDSANEMELGLKELLTEVRQLRVQVEPLVANSNGGQAAGALAVPKHAPALNREPRFADDPWKGRFGGKSENEGFTLSAEFTPLASGNNVRIGLRLFTDRSEYASSVAEFFIHPTFPRDRVKVPLEGGVARLDLIAWGGFTVGAWIPGAQVELELDLAEMPNAPAIIKER